MDRPQISINFAITADGKISTVAGRASGWTSSADFDRLKHLRRAADALMVGRGTLESDRMTMNAPQQPLRCVISRSGVFDASHPLFSSDGGPIHLLGTSAKPTDIPETTAYQTSLASFIQSLKHDHQVTHLHCEGGGQLIRELAEMDWIDDIHLTWAGHTIFGGTRAPTISGIPEAFLPASRPFRLTHFEESHKSGECFLSYQRLRA